MSQKERDIAAVEAYMKAFPRLKDDACIMNVFCRGVEWADTHPADQNKGTLTVQPKSIDDEKIFPELNMNSACLDQHALVMKKGFEMQPIAIWLMLTVSELSEALEADRNNRHADYGMFSRIYYKALQGKGDKDASFEAAFKAAIKDTFEDEIADAFLRLMQICGAFNIDIERHIQLKAMYNQLRPPKHGKAY